MVSLPAAVVFAYTIPIHSTTKFSPFQLMYGRHPAIPLILYSAMDNSEELTYQQCMTKLAKTLIKLQAEAFTETTLSRSKKKRVNIAN